VGIAETVAVAVACVVVLNAFREQLVSVHFFVEKMN